ncbi:hypothetical protein AQUCO_02500296v1 [Aquilegia coerulea]|uniref:Uncharacterized protein n=1 Tax=Aquilegia coerulea TaxID=218851 RepID=A0A2G5DB78_AQUCA|nr:hypothetical protein AQUCO_02500296v1 [Aquilegia coerulea]
MLDFVLYVGGHVWALDWCPGVHQQSDGRIKCEYLAVAAHPPGSSYHNIGAPLTGRGIVQIWGVLHAVEEENLEPVLKSQRPKTRKQVVEEEVINPLKRPRGRPRKESLADSSRGNQMVEEGATQSCNAKEEKMLPPKKARGRPRKHCSTKKNDVKESSVSLGTEIESVPALAVDIIQESSGFLALTDNIRSSEEHVLLESNDIDVGLDNSNRENQTVQVTSLQLCNAEEKMPLPLRKARGRPRKRSPIKKKAIKEASVDLDRYEMSYKKRKMVDKAKVGSPDDDVSRPLLAHDVDMDLHVDVLCENDGYDQDATASTLNVANNGSFEVGNSCFDLPKDVSLPRVVLCLAHNGKVTWDVKWRPPTGSGRDKHCMGYLAVLLGNGSLEVWEVPSPRAVEVLYSGCTQERTDPRYVKLEPVFRCSKLKSGDRHSIPLTVEWSTASPHDLLLAGCHDGTVALWKFSVSCLSQDTRPLLCFSADTLPIRALAWAPDAS